jgi:DNA-binding NarL/FixJ family response regulator
MQPMNRVLVYHRNCLFRDCLITFLQNSFDFDAQSIDHMQGDSAGLVAADGKIADVVLLDLNLPDNRALEIVRSIRKETSQTRIIILVPDDHTGLLECIAAGVQGCVLERASLKELKSAIEKALQGETVCSSEFVATMFSELSRVSASLTWQTPASISRTRLTAREHEVIELLAKRNSNKQIAKELCLSLCTVKNHVHNILEKLNVESRLEAVDRARQEKWLSPF